MILQKPTGFTLIEISLVLVIIGLLIGGILGGREMIEFARIRQTATLIEQLNTATNTFRGKYNCLPGDCMKATSFFTSTQNGNGDEKIFGYDGWGNNNGGTENGNFFLHLIAANLITDSRVCKTGVQSCGINYVMSTWGLKIPLLDSGTNYTGGGGYSALGLINIDNANGCTDAACIHVTASHSYYFSTRTNLTDAGLPSSRLGLLDRKFDDSYPTSGKIQVLGPDYWSLGSVSFSGGQEGLTYWTRNNSTTDVGVCINQSTTPMTYANDRRISCQASWFAQF